ncbi:N-methyl-L-tryptophan oxidase [Rhodococcus sp. NPDC006774]|uniref:N-methyl-L-tryptophan oxidase n=1 Tax=Rhodococcus sp. NPDC006774 TaxID=3157186 RepID=UPI0033E76F1C
MTYDVIVLGIGGMGSAAACHLARRGQRVLGIDQFGPAHALGSSHGGSRIYRQSYFEDPAYVPLLLRAYELWHDLASDSGRDVFTETGGLYVGRPDGLTFGGSLLASEKWGLKHDVLDPAEAQRRFPTVRLQPDEFALFEEKAGIARPETTVAAHLDLAEAAGAELRYDEKVLGWESTDSSVTVTTVAGTYTAGALVISPGAWAPKLLAEIGVPMVVERQVMHWITPQSGEAAFDSSHHPVYICGDGPDQIYGFPAIDGEGGGVKISFFRAGTPCDPDTIDRTVHPEEIARLQQRIVTTFPALSGPHQDAKTCMYTTTPDEHFVVAKHPDHANVTVACGFSGHGFKFVPVIGEVLADLAIDGETKHPIALFDPARSIADQVVSA